MSMCILTAKGSLRNEIAPGLRAIPAGLKAVIAFAVDDDGPEHLVQRSPLSSSPKRSSNSNASFAIRCSDGSSFKITAHSLTFGGPDFLFQCHALSP